MAAVVSLANRGNAARRVVLVAGTIREQVLDHVDVTAE